MKAHDSRADPNGLLDQRWKKWELRSAADNYLDAHWIRLRERFKDGPNRKWKWTLEKWKPSPHDRVRELIIAGALYLAEVERRELTGETAVGSRAKIRTCAIKIERELKREAIRQLKRTHYEESCRSVGKEPDPRVHAKYVPKGFEGIDQCARHSDRSRPVKN